MKRPWDINDFCARVRHLNSKWWQDLETGDAITRNPYELLALVITELAECLEGERKNLMDDHLPHRRMAEVEMADAYIRLADFAGGFGLHLQGSPANDDEFPGNKGEAIFDIMVKMRDIAEAFKVGNKFITSWTVSWSLRMIEIYCEKHGYDLFGAIEEKLAYNAVRKDHTHEARKAAGGKAF